MISQKPLGFGYLFFSYFISKKTVAKNCHLQNYFLVSSHLLQKPFMLWWPAMPALSWLVSAILRIMSRCRTCLFFHTFYKGMFLYISVHLFLFVCFVLFYFVCLFVWFVGSSILSTLRPADVNLKWSTLRMFHHVKGAVCRGSLVLVYIIYGGLVKGYCQYTLENKISGVKV